MEAPLFGAILPQDEDGRDGAIQVEAIGKVGDPKFIQTVELNKRLSCGAKLTFLNGA